MNEWKYILIQSYTYIFDLFLSHTLNLYNFTFMYSLRQRYWAFNYHTKSTLTDFTCMSFIIHWFHGLKIHIDWKHELCTFSPAIVFSLSLVLFLCDISLSSHRLCSGDLSLCAGVCNWWELQCVVPALYKRLTLFTILHQKAAPLAFFLNFLHSLRTVLAQYWAGTCTYISDFRSHYKNWSINVALK